MQLTNLEKAFVLSLLDYSQEGFVTVKEIGQKQLFRSPLTKISQVASNLMEKGLIEQGWLLKEVSKQKMQKRRLYRICKSVLVAKTLQELLIKEHAPLFLQSKYFKEYCCGAFSEEKVLFELR